MQHRATAGIVAAAYAPSALEVAVGGVPVCVELQTDYPFREELRFTVRAPRHGCASRCGCAFPAWASGSERSRSTARPTPVADAGTFHTIERDWNGSAEVVLSLPMTPRVLQRPRGAVSLARGPLLYALRIGERWQRINEDQPHRELPHADWEIFPTTPWNFALELGDGELNEAVRFTEHSLGSPVFAPDAPPVSATVKGRRVPEWGAEGGSAAPPPAGPVRHAGPAEDLDADPLWLQQPAHRGVSGAVARSVHEHSTA